MDRAGRNRLAVSNPFQILAQAIDYRQAAVIVRGH